ncbi:hypothetical protein L211DRAFT_851420 [Terfezia boudieri ATCC MYA-4762]|uniref:Cora-domain-containing protein n=1 Tax=Terfezia boudieri ATCC MYA-4762 TaxID=1051890 RepID=A0A3N4LJ24_9PEZI|nr:hypothetical protein L211DRAFT_851420 [Terfezia boudieri ATCC MYA-4762]
MVEHYIKDENDFRRVITRKFKKLEELRSVYRTERSEANILRIFHVQNCSWGEDYLMRKHAFDAHARIHTSSGNSSTGPTDFGRWVKERRPPRRLGKLMMSSRAWKTHSDPWRGVAKTAFGIDYMKAYSCEVDEEPRRRTLGEDGDAEVGERDRVLGLQGFDDEDNTIHAYNIYSQRLAVYVQYKYCTPPAPHPDVVCPSGNNPRMSVKRYDNGNTILIIDNSHTNSIYDTLTPARGHLESKWRRLPFTAKELFDGIEGDKEAHINMYCMKAIVQDIFKALVSTWGKVLELSWEHVSILEDSIYEQPADESRAPELWENSAFWNRYEKLMFYHVDTMNDMRRYLGEFVDGVEDSGSEAEGNRIVGGAIGPAGVGQKGVGQKGVGQKGVGQKGVGQKGVGQKGAWLEELPADFDKLGNLIQEDLVKPTASLSELMYRSVATRDSRASLQLGSSMWRLSWITFIFLPATFIVGFFGMNVKTFAGGSTPDIKWFFIALLPFFAVVIVGWYLLKHLLAKNPRAPIQRGLYEALYSHLEEQNPSLWTRQGPSEYVVPADWASKVKWRLIKYWAKDDSRAMKPGAVNEPIGGWERIKRGLIERWTREIKIVKELGPGIGTRRLLEREELGLELELQLGEVSTVEIPIAERVVPAEGGQNVEGRSVAEGAPTGKDMVFPSASPSPGVDEDSEVLVEERWEGEGVTEEGRITQLKIVRGVVVSSSA